jgi:uncharacterized protein YxjI
MSHYRIREKVLCFGDDFTIRDAAGRDVYYVDGKVLTIRDALSFQDMEGNELAVIRRKLLSIGRTYVIERGGRTTTVHKHLFTLLRCRFTVDVPGPGDLEAVGSFLDHEYEFRDAGGGVVARVGKKWLALTDTYAVDVADGADDVLILAAAIVIDRCCHEDRD